MKIFYCLIYIVGGSTLAYHAWVGLSAYDAFWRFFVCAYIVLGALCDLCDKAVEILES